MSTERAFKLDPVTHDLVHDGTRLVRVSGVDAIAQSLKTRLSLFRGEALYDEAEGVPYFESVFGQKTPTAAIREVFRKITVGTPGVAELHKLDLRASAVPRSFTLSISVSTDLDELINLTIPIGV